MSANVSIITGQVKDVICVDNKAFKFSPEDNGKKYENQGVWVLTSNGPKRIEVELGLSDDSKTQIVSGNITEKDKIIVSSVNKKGKKPANRSMRPPM